MNLRQLEILRAVMKRRTTTGAAHELGMSQPAVSNAIKHTEDHLGYPLFDRINNRLVPTREARILFEESENLFGLYDAFRRKSTELASGRMGQLSILVTAELSESLIPKALERFLQRHTKVKCSIEILPLESVLDGIEAGLADVGFAMAAHSRPGLAYEPLFEVEMLCACPAGHALTALPFVGPPDLQHHRLISAPIAGRIHTMVEEAFSEASAHFEPQIEVRFMNVAARCAVAGVGVALVDALTASANKLDGVEFVPFSPMISIPVYSILRSGRPPSRMANRFIQHTRDELVAVNDALQSARSCKSSSASGQDREAN